MRILVSNIIKLLSKPFREHFLFLIAFFVLATSAYFLIYIKLGYYYYFFLVLFHCILVSYAVAFVVGLISNNSIRKFLQIILIGISALLFLLNTYCLFELGTLLDADYAMLAYDTNPNEAREFLSTFVHLPFILTLLVTYAVFILIWAISQKHPIRLGRRTAGVGVGIVLICAIMNFKGWGIWVDGPIGKLTEFYRSLDEYDLPDDSQFNINLPTLTFDDTRIPSNVVLIIGESFDRYHSSLYGYNKETNPCLRQLKKSTMLFAFDSIDSPAATTSLSLKYTLSTYSRNLKSQKRNWYQYPTLIEIMKACGFNCYWFSNQKQFGKHNNIGRFFSSKCDQYWFLQNKDQLLYDSVLVDSTIHFVEELKSEDHNFIVYHMMGSHFEYEKRYPKEFVLFKESDYLEYPQNQRFSRSSYDNSLRYNDYIVMQIINIYKDTESIVIYLPDHGQDIYYSSPDYCAHGKKNDSISYAYGVKIPFFVYASSLYQEMHPDVLRRIKNRQDFPKSWNSDYLPYFIMDLIGIKYINGDSVKSKSILN